MNNNRPPPSQDRNWKNSVPSCNFRDEEERNSTAAFRSRGSYPSPWPRTVPADWKLRRIRGTRRSRYCPVLPACVQKCLLARRGCVKQDFQVYNFCAREEQQPMAQVNCPAPRPEPLAFSGAAFEPFPIYSNARIDLRPATEQCVIVRESGKEPVKIFASNCQLRVPLWSSC